MHLITGNIKAGVTKRQVRPITLSDNPVQITDTTFRDAHQSLMATRLRMEDMKPMAPAMDAVGFHSMEVWGGATFDVSTRFLAEDPWERLRTFKRLIPNTPLMMLLRGQALVGYRTYADDVVDAFVGQAARAGIDIFRVFDALNDRLNVRHAAEAVKRAGKHLQLAICYSITEEGRLGGPIYNLDYFLEKARTFQAMGADSICLKDMGGLMAPYDAYELVAALKGVLDVPLQLHTHYTSGMASMTVLKAIEAGVDAVDACLAPLALRTSQPAVEPLVVALSAGERDSGLDVDQLLRLGDELEAVLPKYRGQMESPRAAVIDAKVLRHQIPGGMASNLISQLRDAGALDRLDEVLEEIPKTRRELGYPPLVTPASQMVGTQAVSNVLFGRYKMMSQQVRDYIGGLYGLPPAPFDTSVAEIALQARDGGPKTAGQRPADLLEPELDRAREAIKHLSNDIEDILTYALYPTTGMSFLRIKHGLDPAPVEQTPRSAGPAERAGEPKIATRADRDGGSTGPPSLSRKARRFNVYVGEEYYQVEVDPVAPSRAKISAGGTAASSKIDVERVQSHAQETAISAPMPGIVLRYEVEVGQRLQEGDPAVVLEAMKMENTLPSPVAGTVTSLGSPIGATVAKGDPLVIIAP